MSAFSEMIAARRQSDPNRIPTPSNILTCYSTQESADSFQERVGGYYWEPWGNTVIRVRPESRNLLVIERGNERFYKTLVGFEIWRQKLGYEK